MKQLPRVLLLFSFLFVACAPVTASAPAVPTETVDRIYNNQEIFAQYGSNSYHVQVDHTAVFDQELRPDLSIPSGILLNRSEFAKILAESNGPCLNSSDMQILADGAQKEWVYLDFTPVNYTYRISLGMGEEKFNIGLLSACWFYGSSDFNFFSDQKLDDQIVRTGISWGWAVVYIREGKSYEEYVVDATADWLDQKELMSAADYAKLVDSIPVGDLPVTFLFK